MPRTAQQYLKDYFALLTEMQERGFVRTRNAPLGDLAEYVVMEAYNGHLVEKNSVKSFDLVDDRNRRVQVKACAARAGGSFSAFRSFDFELAVFIIVDPETGDLTEAWEMTPEDVEQNCTHSAHTNSSTITVAKVRRLGTDVTELVREAFANA